jgi:acylphosphatase
LSYLYFDYNKKTAGKDKKGGDFSMKTLHIIVTGRVQGVGFRFHTQTSAAENELTGWVKNREDGSVEIMAQGQSGHLEVFLNALKKGSRYSNAENVSVTEERDSETFSSFEILY